MAEEQEEMFPELARRALEARGLNPHSQRRLTGIDHVTMGGILGGVQKVSLETVEKFARGLGLDVNRARQAAGYPAVPPPYDPYQHFGEGLRDLAQRYTEEAVRRVAATHIPLGNASREHVEQALRDLETDIREELGAR